MTFIRKTLFRSIYILVIFNMMILDSSCMTNMTKEIEDKFEQRTGEHIGKVIANMRVMTGYCGLSAQTLEERGSAHDKSKFSQEEREGYIWLTWFYHCQKLNIPFNYPDGVEKLVEKAKEHHLTNNLHHPESHKDPNLMTSIDLVEMVCDWMALSQEYGEQSCKKWVEVNKHRWNFSAEQWNFIFLIIDELYNRLKQEKIQIK